MHHPLPFSILLSSLPLPPSSPLSPLLQEIKNAREFLTQLNSHLARAVSILLFIFLTSSIQGSTILHTPHTICSTLYVASHSGGHCITTRSSHTAILSPVHPSTVSSSSSSSPAFYGLHQVTRDDSLVMAAVGGILSAVQWTTILALPLIQVLLSPSNLFLLATSM